MHRDQKKLDLRLKRRILSAKFNNAFGWPPCLKQYAYPVVTTDTGLTDLFPVMRGCQKNGGCPNGNGGYHGCPAGVSAIVATRSYLSPKQSLMTDGAMAEQCIVADKECIAICIIKEPHKTFIILIQMIAW